MGFYIDWSTDATTDVTTNTASVDTSDTGNSITMTITLNVSTVGLSTATDEKLDAVAVTTVSTFTWYIAMMNGAIYSQTDPSVYTDRYFDFAEGVVTFTTADGTPDTLTANWATFDDITDKHCVDALGATCTNDVDATGGTSDYLHSPSESSSYELCSMIWEFNDNSKQCMQL